LVRSSLVRRCSRLYAKSTPQKKKNKQSHESKSKPLLHRGQFSSTKKCDALNAGDLEALAAADVLAHHHVVTAQHVGLCLGKLRSIAFVDPRRQTLFLRAHQPLNLILRCLMAVRTIQCRGLLVRTFIKKIALFHVRALGVGLSALATRFSAHAQQGPKAEKPKGESLSFDYCTFAAINAKMPTSGEAVCLPRLESRGLLKWRESEKRGPFPLRPRFAKWRASGSGLRSHRIRSRQRRRSPKNTNLRWASYSTRIRFEFRNPFLLETCGHSRAASRYCHRALGRRRSLGDAGRAPTRKTPTAGSKQN
jgi:hypothetical protein